MDQISEMLRALFQTKNPVTFALSATGGAGMETAFVNFVEPGDTVVIGVKGFFGERMTEVAARTGREDHPGRSGVGKADRTRNDDQGVEGSIRKQRSAPSSMLRHRRGSDSLSRRSGPTAKRPIRSSWSMP